MINIKSSRKEQERIDTLQPFKADGKRNEKFEQFYGDVGAWIKDKKESKAGLEAKKSHDPERYTWIKDKKKIYT